MKTICMIITVQNDRLTKIKHHFNKVGLHNDIRMNGQLIGH